MTFYDMDKNIVGSHYATPVVPIIQPESRTPLKGEFYEFDPLSEPWDAVEYFVCGALDETFYLDEVAGWDLSLENVEEALENETYEAEGVIRNSGDVSVENVGIYAIFRDEEDLFCGYGFTFPDRAVPAGKTLKFSVDVGVNTLVPFDPFDIGSGDISAELVLSRAVAGYGINCSSFEPD